MAASVPSFCTVNSRCSYPSWRSRRHGLRVIKVQSFQEEGRSINSIVDENLNGLKQRIEMVKVKERLERCCRCQHGWNYAPIYNHKLKRSNELSKLFELTCLVCGTVGFTFVSGTFLLCLVSLVVHMQG